MAQLELTITGDYRRARLRDTPRAGWINARAYSQAERSSTAGRRFVAWMWAACSLPATWLESMLAVLAPGQTLCVAPASGTPRAAQVVKPPPQSTSPTPIAAATLLALLLVLPVIYSYGWWPIVLLAVAWVIVIWPKVLTYAVHVRDRPLRGRGWPPGATVELTSLCAWPPGTGHGKRLFNDVLVDVRAALPPDQFAALDPGSAALFAHYTAAGFAPAPETYWMVIAGPHGRQFTGT
jgi:hypothetical protein